MAREANAGESRMRDGVAVRSCVSPPTVSVTISMVSAMTPSPSFKAFLVSLWNIGAIDGGASKTTHSVITSQALSNKYQSMDKSLQEAFNESTNHLVM